MKRFTALAATALSTALLAAPLHAQNIADVCPAPLSMADTGIEGMGNLQEAFGPFAAKF